MMKNNRYTRRLDRQHDFMIRLEVEDKVEDKSTDDNLDLSFTCDSTRVKLIQPYGSWVRGCQEFYIYLTSDSDSECEKEMIQWIKNQFMRK